MEDAIFHGDSMRFLLAGLFQTWRFSINEGRLPLCCALSPEYPHDVIESDGIPYPYDLHQALEAWGNIRNDSYDLSDQVHQGILASQERAYEAFLGFTDPSSPPLLLEKLPPSVLEQIRAIRFDPLMTRAIKDVQSQCKQDLLKVVKGGLYSGTLNIVQGWFEHADRGLLLRMSRLLGDGDARIRDYMTCDGEMQLLDSGFYSIPPDILYAVGSGFADVFGPVDGRGCPDGQLPESEELRQAMGRLGICVINVPDSREGHGGEKLEVLVPPLVQRAERIYSFLDGVSHDCGRIFEERGSLPIVNMRDAQRIQAYTGNDLGLERVRTHPILPQKCPYADHSGAVSAERGEL
jgi:hypothetical protein